MLNTTSLTCWCYECDEEVYPDVFEDLIAPNLENECESLGSDSNRSMRPGNLLLIKPLLFFSWARKYRQLVLH